MSGNSPSTRAVSPSFGDRRGAARRRRGPASTVADPATGPSARES